MTQRRLEGAKEATLSDIEAFLSSVAQQDSVWAAERVTAFIKNLLISRVILAIWNFDYVLLVGRVTPLDSFTALLETKAPEIVVRLKSAPDCSHLCDMIESYARASKKSCTVVRQKIG